MTTRLRRWIPASVALLGAAVSVSLVAFSLWLENRDAALSSAPGPGAGRTARERLRKLDWLQHQELFAYDWRARRAAENGTAVTPGLGLVVADEESILELQRGTVLGVSVGLLWPRFVYGLVLHELRTQGAQGVAMDVLTADERLDHGNVPLEGLTNLTSDGFFAQEVTESGNIVLAAKTNSYPIWDFRAAAWTLGDVEAPKDVDGKARRVRAFTDYLLPNPRIENLAEKQKLRLLELTPTAVVLGSRKNNQPTLWPINPDGSVKVSLRTGSMLVDSAYVTNRVWHLGIALAALRLGLDLGAAQVQPGRIVFPDTNGVAVRVLPVSQDNVFPINWSTVIGPQSKVPAQGLIELVARSLASKRVGPDRWTNALIVIGSTANGANMADRGATPISDQDYMMSTHFNVADSMIRGQFVHSPPAGVTVLITLAAALLGSGLAWRLRWGRAVLVAALLVAGWLFVADFVFQRNRLWLPVAHPLIGGLAFNLAAMMVYRGKFEQSERQRVRSIFSKIVSPNVVQELLKAEQVGLGGARRQLTVFFADVRGFTEMTDRAQAAAEDHVRAASLGGAEAEAHFAQQSAEVLATVNIYLATIADVIKRHRGTLDKYIGDCVMAFWGAPTLNPRHAVDAVCAAIEAQRAILRLNTEREAENQRRDAENPARIAQGQVALPHLVQLSLGTGINTGFMTVGLMGSESHILNYTVFGREVNLAARLEGVSGRGRIIIGEATYRELSQHLPELAARCVALEPVTVKGFRQAMPVYEVPWRDDATAALATAPPITRAEAPVED